MPTQTPVVRPIATKTTLASRQLLAKPANFVANFNHTQLKSPIETTTIMTFHLVASQRKHNKTVQPKQYTSINNFILPNVFPSYLYAALATILILLHATQTSLASSVIMVRPIGQVATLVPGQPLHFECTQIAIRPPQFVWYYSKPGDTGPPQPIDPNADDMFEVHNGQLTLKKPNYNSLGDYMCRALKNDKTEDENESALIKLRASPYIDDFGVDTSHTGKSSVVTDGQRLELICRVIDDSAAVNITWLRSEVPDDDRSKFEIKNPEPQDFVNMAPPNIFVEQIGNFTKKLVIEQVGPEHRGYYTCMADNGVTDRSQKTIFIRVKDTTVALWPFLGILAELFILFTIIYVWETQRAHKELLTTSGTAAASPTFKRPASGPTNSVERVPLNR